ncbi:MAG: tetratricopeptide repeat protein [Bacteroidales bacterium]|nr:tetratricopeptide repeat protein [Bacteroidales bacterium]
MKRTIMLLTFVFAFSAIFAQKSAVTSAQNFKNAGNLDQALQAINEAVDTSNPKAAKTHSVPKTWEARGDILQAIFRSNDKNIIKDPLTEAYNSYKKAIELDTKKSSERSIKLKLTLLTNDLLSQASQAFSDSDFELAQKSFEMIMEINESPLIKGDNQDYVDTVIIFNAGLAAYNAENFDNAIEYFTEAAEYGYDKGNTYTLIAATYESKKTASDTLKALDVLKEGFEKYPEDNAVLTSLIQIYLDMKQPEDAMKYLELAISKDPSNPIYYFAQGGLYEQLEREEDAIGMYEKALSVDSDFFDANFNLGVLYYNKGINQINLANNIPPTETARYEEEVKKADDWWKKSLPYMERCREIKPDDETALESLKNLYYRLKDMDKYNAILEILE